MLENCLLQKKKTNFIWFGFYKSVSRVNSNYSHVLVKAMQWKILPGGKREWRVAAWCILGDRSSHVNFMSHTLMAWTDVWPGNQEEKKVHAFRRFNKQHMFHWGGYSTLDLWVPTGVSSRVGRLWQDAIRGDAALSFGWLSIPEAVRVWSLSLDRF